MTLAKELAICEVGGWKAHHRRDDMALLYNMTRLYAIQYNIPYGDARRATSLNIQAAKEHNLAEKCEDQGNQSQAEEHWGNAKNLIEEHYNTLMGLLPRHLRVSESDCAKLAEYEVGWWKAHHRKDTGGIIGNMAKRYALQYSIQPELAEDIVLKRVEAAVEHDKAEEFEELGKQAEANKHWQRTEKLLTEHFAYLTNGK